MKRLRNAGALTLLMLAAGCGEDGDVAAMACDEVAVAAEHFREGARTEFADRLSRLLQSEEVLQEEGLADDLGAVQTAAVLDGMGFDFDEALDDFEAAWCR